MPIRSSAKIPRILLWLPAKPLTRPAPLYVAGQSKAENNFNAIGPNFVLDGNGGKWLVSRDARLWPSKRFPRLIGNKTMES
jgi:hypothetical protein